MARLLLIPRRTRGDSGVHAPPYQVLCLILVVEVFGAGRSCQVNEVGTIARIDFVERVWEGSAKRQDTCGRSSAGGRQMATTGECRGTCVTGEHVEL
jgi:hypothetical protein